LADKSNVGGIRTKGLERMKKQPGRLGKDYGHVRFVRFTHEDYAYRALCLSNRAEE